MEAQVHYGSVEMSAPVFEALPWDGRLPSSYPLPALRASGSGQPREFQSIVLENPLLRATFLPELGGRLISLFDKRTATECLHLGGELHAAAEPIRGAWIPDGLQWQVGEVVRRRSMAEVDVQVIEASEDGSVRIVLFELATGQEMSWHLSLALPADRAVLRGELRALNRSLKYIPYQTALSAPAERIADFRESTLLFDVTRQAGVGIHRAPGSARGSDLKDGIAFVSREPTERFLAPRQTDHWRFSITPVSGIGEPRILSEACAVGWSDGCLEVLSTELLLGAKLFLQTPAEETLETQLDLLPDTRLRLELPERLDPQAALFRDGSGREILRWSKEPQSSFAKNPSTRYSGQEPTNFNPLNEESIEQARFDPRLRGSAHIALAHRHVETEDWTAADDAIDEALLFNGDDPLAWWLKSAVARHGSGDAEAALLNAHYLAPMEPLLRAEAFLRQTDRDGPGPSALLEIIGTKPDLLVECACRLIEASRRHDAAVWIEEALRHNDVTMLRHLAAWNLSKTRHLGSEAAIQLAAADTREITPPFPFREIERTALEDLRQAFPDSASVAKMLDMMMQNCSAEVS